MKRNVTVQLDEEVIGKAKVLAAQRGTSISGLLAAELTRLTEQKKRYERARDAALAQMTEVAERAAVGDRGDETTWRDWSREDIYAERTERWPRS